MSSMNLVVLIGRVVAPPELRYTPGGKAVASFTLAVDRTRGSKNSEQKECDFIPIVAWERLAEVCNEYLTKGKLISIQGSLRTRTYETQDGQKRKAFEVTASEMQMLGGGAKREDDGPRSDERPKASGPPAGWGSGDGFDADDLSVDEIPF